MSKFILNVILLSLSLSSLNAQVLNNYNQIIFWSPQIALQTYAGDWKGSQAMYVDSNHTHLFTIQILLNSIPNQNYNQLNCETTIETYSKSPNIKLRSIIKISNNSLELSNYNEKGKNQKYIAKISFTSIEWTAIPLFFNYDVQLDKFFQIGNATFIKSLGKKYFSTKKNLSGLLRTESEFLKIKNRTPQKSIQISPSFKFR